MKYHPFILVALATLIWCSCGKDDFVDPKSALLKSVPADRYYKTDPLVGPNAQLYGVWEAVGSSGGLHGGGYALDFDFLLFKPNAIFGVVRNDSLVAWGKLDILEDPAFDLLFNFVPEGDPQASGVHIMHDRQKFAVFRSDTLFLNSPCCDRLNTVLARR
jgi:hypothetical protein